MRTGLMPELSMTVIGLVSSYVENRPLMLPVGPGNTRSHEYSEPAQREAISLPPDDGTLPQVEVVSRADVGYVDRASHPDYAEADGGGPTSDGGATACGADEKCIEGECTLCEPNCIGKNCWVKFSNYSCVGSAEWREDSCGQLYSLKEECAPHEECLGGQCK